MVGMLAASNCDLAKAEQDRFRGNPKTIEKWIQLLPLGSTREQVVQTVGSPSNESKYDWINEEVWNYYGIVLNPITENTKDLRLLFALNGQLIEVSAP